MRKLLFAGIILTMLTVLFTPAIFTDQSYDAADTFASHADLDDGFTYVTYVVESVPDGFNAPKDTFVLRGQVVPTGSDVEGYTKSILVNGVQADGPVIAGDEDMEICIAFSQDLDHMVAPCIALIGIGVIINVAALFYRRLN